MVTVRTVAGYAFPFRCFDVVAHARWHTGECVRVMHSIFVRRLLSLLCLLSSQIMPAKRRTITSAAAAAAAASRVIRKYSMQQRRRWWWWRRRRQLCYHFQVVFIRLCLLPVHEQSTWLCADYYLLSISRFSIISTFSVRWWDVVLSSSPRESERQGDVPVKSTSETLRL